MVMLPLLSGELWTSSAGVGVSNTWRIVWAAPPFSLFCHLFPCVCLILMSPPPLSMFSVHGRGYLSLQQAPGDTNWKEREMGGKTKDDGNEGDKYITS